MNDQLPDFEAAVPPVVDYPKPKKPRRKPARRKAAPVVDRGAAIRFGKAKAKKRKAVAKRRGRPAGSLNKPKTTERAPYQRGPQQEVFLSDAVYKTIRTLVDLSASERDMVFSIVKGLTK